MTLLMIRPARFVYNAQTAVNNAFQQQDNDQQQVAQKAVEEFDGFVAELRRHDIAVLVIQDTDEPHTPDSIFPNNWISFHEGGSIVLYPMFADNRRQERKAHVLSAIDSKFKINQAIDFTSYEQHDLFLEGTGSIVLDRVNKLAYACLSPRTDEILLDKFCKRMGYTPITFTAVDATGMPIYHTNVMMCVADEYVVINLDCIVAGDRQKVVSAIEQSGKEIIPISQEQMNHFAGNMLQVQSQSGEQFLVMSSQAYDSLSAEQIAKLESFNTIIHAPIPTIETNGGGSARCMMAEVPLENR